MKDIRFYFDGHGQTYRLQCVGCGADIWAYPHALEIRHILAVSQATVDHICGPIARQYAEAAYLAGYEAGVKAATDAIAKAVGGTDD